VLALSRGESRADSQTSRLIGIPASLLLLVWLDSWIGNKLAPGNSNQLAWAIWFMICIPLALWPAFYRLSWKFALSAALFRSLEKTVVMAICWWQYTVHNYHPEKLSAALSQPNVWTNVFLPELCLFLSAYWMGLWLSDIVRTSLVDETQQDYDARVDRVTQFIAAIAPILGFLGAVLAAAISNK
jgi:hypothetical protein